MVTPDSPVPAEAKIAGEPLAPAKYTIVACDIDATGKRLIDEIVQIATYSPIESFSQYIMPLMNLNPAARQRHQVRVITVGFFRMLKSMQTYKVIKTKTEVAALNDFLAHLEELKNKDQDSQGIILLFHEQRKLVPYMLIEAMKKYNMLPRFLNVVKSFVNTYNIAVEKCGNTMKYFSLRQVAKALLDYDDSPNNKDLFEGSAAIRSKLVYEIAEHLARGDEKDLNKDQLSEKMCSLAISYAASITSLEVEELQEQERILERQSSLRPIFLQYFKTTLYHRVKAVTFRRVLAEHGHDLDDLQKLWTDSKKDGLATCLEGCTELKEQDRNELIEILDHHFDPEKQPVKPNIRRRMSRRRSRSSGNPNNNNNNVKQENQHKMGHNMQEGATQMSNKSPRKFFRNNRNRINRKQQPLAAAN